MKISRIILTGALALGLAVVAFVALHGPAALAQEGPGLVVFASNVSGNYEIYTLDSETGLKTQLTNTPQNDVEPVWSPDGEFIAFASNRDGDYELFVMRADGTDVRQLTNNLAEDRQPRWQPDGGTIVFASNVNGQWDLYAVSADGAIVRQLTNDPADERGPEAAAGLPPGPVGPAGPTPTQSFGQPTPMPDGIVDSDRLNVRANPGEGGRILEVLTRGMPVSVLGRFFDSSWIQVQTPTGTVGWVAAWLVELNIDLARVPIVNAQFIAPPPTATPAPTITPTPQAAISFWSSKGTITAGECVTIGWDVEGIKEVYYQNVGVTGHESRQECPATTTTYHLRVVLLDGQQQDRYITITVTAP